MLVPFLLRSGFVSSGKILTMFIRLAKPQDIEPILDVIEAARQLMRESGNTAQWTNGYPAAHDLLTDMDKSAGFVVEVDEVIVGYFALYRGYRIEPTYEEIEAGDWLNDLPYAVVHRMASNGRYKGIAQAVFDFAFTCSNTVRVDTHRDNVPMKALMQKLGFIYCGVIYVSDGTPRLAFQLTK